MSMNRRTEIPAREIHRELHDLRDGFRDSPFTWKMGTCNIRATCRRRKLWNGPSFGGVVKPFLDLIVDDDMKHAADSSGKFLSC